MVPHGRQGLGADVYVTAPFLIVEPGGVGQGGHDADLLEELAQVGAVASPVHRSRCHRTTVVATGLPGPQNHSLFCPLTAVGKPSARPSSLIAPASP